MPQYKLMYFNGRGRAEITRMLFALKLKGGPVDGIEFEDYRFKDGEWPTLKPDQTMFPLGQAPVLLIDGKSHPQSGAIQNHIAREFGFYGSNNSEAFEIDIIGDTIADLFNKYVPILFEKDPEKKKASLAEYKTKTSSVPLTFLQKKVEGKRFFVGDKESIADCGAFHLLDTLACDAGVGEDFLKTTYPGLWAFYKGIVDNSNLTEYLKSRPPPTF